jgi:hypothetical protein
MSATVVRPFASNISCARAKALSRCTGSGAGTVRSTSAIAASTKTPLGAALAARPARSMRPPSGARVAAVIPASRIATLLAQPAWPSTRSSQIGRSPTIESRSAAGREPAEAPAFLVPAAADDPARRGIGGGILADPAERLLEAVGVGEVELEGVEAEAHDMAMGVDQAGNQRPAAAVEQILGPFRPAIATVEQLLHPPVVADHDAGEADQAAIGSDRVAVDIVDQRIGKRRGGREQGGQDEEQSLQGSSLRIRDEVSCRPAPIACRSA